MVKPDWLKKIKIFAKADTSKSILYIITSVIPYSLILVGMLCLSVMNFPYWIILLLSVIDAGFLVRTFMILHDCAHGSFLKSKKACSILGLLSGILTLTPFPVWRKNHALHHANVGNLDKRGIGDVWVMTLKEYEASTSVQKMQYRIFRNPFVLFLVLPQLLFILSYRIPHKNSHKGDNFSILLIDLVLFLVLTAAYFTIGIDTYLAVQLPVWFIGNSAGVWLFYIQHQFKTVQWQRQEDWDLISAATKGSSFYRLPGLLRWFSGNIGFHNLHHLNPRIPSYNLKPCYESVKELQTYGSETLMSAFKSLRLHLWDEDEKKLVGFNGS